MSSSEDENTEGLLECIDQAFFPNSVLNSNKQCACGPGNLQKSDVTALAKSKKGNTPQLNQYNRTEKKNESLPFGMTVLEPGAQRMLAKQLQRKLDEDLEFKDSHDTSKSSNNDDQGIRLLRQSGECFLLASNAKQPPKIQTKPDIQSRRRKRFESEDDTEVDFASIAVSPEWVLEKRGIYGNGREKQGELITGAVHSPLLKRNKL